MPIGGANTYPAIADVTNLVRSIVQDDMAGATGTLGEGQIFVDNEGLSVTMGTFFNSALRTLCRKLRTSTGPMLIRDNVLVLGLPPMNSPTQGIAAPDPDIQTQLSYVGFFDGLMWNAGFALPPDCLMVERVWERLNGSNFDFRPMRQPANGLPSTYQGVYNGQWEWRQDSVWMPGSLQSMDLRLRYSMQLPTLYTSSIDTTETYIPINDCQEIMAAFIIELIGVRQGAATLPMAMQWAQKQIDDFINEQVKRDQGNPYTVQSFHGQRSGGCDDGHNN